ncbi:MAG: hypothetical protein ABSA74_00595 [Candidatus Staskawiczbacteria bacterium]|jgi:hypothetical protein
MGEISNREKSDIYRKKLADKIKQEPDKNKRRGILETAKLTEKKFNIQFLVKS